MNCEDSWVFLSTSPRWGTWTQDTLYILLADRRAELSNWHVPGAWVSYGFMVFSFCAPVLVGWLCTGVGDMDMGVVLRWGDQVLVSTVLLTLLVFLLMLREIAYCFSQSS